MMNALSYPNSLSAKEASHPICCDTNNQNISKESKVNNFVLSFLKTAVITAGISTAVAATGLSACGVALALFPWRQSIEPIEKILFVANTIGAVLTGAALAKNKKLLGGLLGTAVITATCYLASLHRHFGGETHPLIPLGLTAMSLIAYVTTSLVKNRALPRQVLVGHLLAVGVLAIACIMDFEVTMRPLFYCAMLIGVSIMNNLIAMNERKNQRNSTLGKVASSIALITASVPFFIVAGKIFERASDAVFLSGRFPPKGIVPLAKKFSYEILKNTFRVISAMRAKELMLAGMAGTSIACVLKREGKIGDIAKDFFASLAGCAPIYLATVLMLQGTIDFLFPFTTLVVATGVVAARILKV